MLAILTAPLCAAVLAIAYIWGADPNGAVMQTGYVLSGLVVFFTFLGSET